MADQAVGLLSSWLRRTRIRAVLPYLRGNVLDYGCGIGSLAAHVGPGRYFGFDVDAESIDDASAIHPQHRFGTELPKHSRFTTIAALAVIEHVADPAAMLSDLRPLLEPDGRIVLTTPHPAGGRIHAAGARLGLFSRLASEEHVQLLDRASMRDCAAAAGFRIDRCGRFLVGFNQLFVLQQVAVGG